MKKFLWLTMIFAIFIGCSNSDSSDSLDLLSGNTYKVIKCLEVDGTVITMNGEAVYIVKGSDTLILKKDNDSYKAILNGTDVTSSYHSSGATSVKKDYEAYSSDFEVEWTFKDGNLFIESESAPYVVNGSSATIDGDDLSMTLETSDNWKTFSAVIIDKDNNEELRTYIFSQK